MKKPFHRTVLILLLTAALSIHASAATPSAAKQFGNAIADAVDRVMPAVVVIRTAATVLHTAHDPFGGGTYRIPERLAGQGSGVIIRSNGYILTSRHVIQRAQKIEVVLSDESRFSARVVGEDPFTDLAVLAIENAEIRVFPVAEPGDSEALRIGEFVIAIGSPFSLNSSVTLGIVSQKGRSVGLLPQEDFIQTDAPINPGNSGGALVDADGKLVGINSVIQTGGPGSLGNIGIGFAVPVHLALRVADDLIRHGRVERPWLGVLTDEGRYDTAPEGVRIADVIGRSPADLAGLQIGDVILRVNDRPVSSSRDIRAALWLLPVGKTVRVDIRRDGQPVAVDVAIGRMPDNIAE